MNTPSEHRPAPSLRSCDTCVPMLAAEAAVRRVDAQRDILLTQDRLRVEQDLQKASNIFVFLFRKWCNRPGSPRLDGALLDNDRLRVASYRALEQRRDNCPGQVCDEHGENYRCGFDKGDTKDLAAD